MFSPLEQKLMTFVASVCTVANVKTEDGRELFTMGQALLHEAQEEYRKRILTAQYGRHQGTTDVIVGG